MTDHISPTSPKQDDIDIKKILLNFWNQWHWFLASIIISLIIAFLINRYTTPIYQVKSSLLVKENSESSPLSSNGALSGQALEGFGLMGGNSNLYNQQEILYSWPIIRKTVEALNIEVSFYLQGHVQDKEIYTNAPFEVRWEKEHPQVVGLDFHLIISSDGSLHLTASGENVRVHDYVEGKNLRVLPMVNIDHKSRAGEEISSDDYAFTVLLKPDFHADGDLDYFFRYNTLEQLERYYLKNLSIGLKNDMASLLALELKDLHAAKGIDFLNMLMQVYEQDNLDQKNDYANRTITFINSQLADISDSLGVSEQEMLLFRTDHQLIDLSMQSEILLTSLTEMDNEKVVLETQNKYYRYLSGYISENKELEAIMAPSAMGVDDPLLTTLIEELNNVLLEKARLGNVKSSPRLNQLNGQIEHLKAAMVDNIHDVISQGDIRLADLKQRIRRTEQLVKQLPSTERDYVNIERRYRLNNETYTFLLQKLSEAQIAKASNVPDSRVVEGAKYSSLIAPKTQQIYMIALFLGLFIPIIVILLQDFFSNKVRSQEDIEKLSSLPVLGHIFFNHDKENHNTPVLDKPNSVVSEPYRGLRNKMNLMTRGKEKPVIAVTSTAPEEGKSYTAINLASSFALMHKKTVLLDLDLRNSDIHNMLKLPDNKGVVNYIMGDASFDDIHFEVKHKDFHVIPAGPIPPNPGEMLNDPRLLQLMEELKQHYDVIVIDFAPVGYVTDLFQIREMMDATIFVVRNRKTNRNWLKNALQEIKTHELKGVGIVINAVKQTHKGYMGYGYGYGYGEGNKKNKGRRKKPKKS